MTYARWPGAAPRPPGGIRRGLARPALRVGVQVDHREGLAGEARGGPGVDQQHRGGAVVQHVAQPLLGVARVQRDVRAPRLQHGQEGDHQLRAALDADRHPHVGSHARARGGGAPAGWRARSAPRTSASGPRRPRRRPRACAPPAPRTARARTSAEARPPCGSTPPAPGCRSAASSSSSRSTARASSAAICSSTRRR